jgi:hypothetical protein
MRRGMLVLEARVVGVTLTYCYLLLPVTDAVTAVMPGS